MLRLRRGVREGRVSLRFSLFLAALLPVCTAAELSLPDVRSLREGDAADGLNRLGTDSSQAASFLRCELTLRKGDAKDARVLARAFLRTWPGSPLAFRARLLEGWASLSVGEIGNGIDALVGVVAGTDTSAARQARESLSEWVLQQQVPAPELLRLQAILPPGGDTLPRSILDAFTRRKGASAKGPVVVVLPQSGDFGAIGRRMTAGTRQALAKDAEIIVLDEPTDPVQVAHLMRGILNTCHPRAIVGPLLSAAATVAAQEVARLSPETPLILPAATSPGIAKLSPNAAQINLTTEAQGRAAARLARSCVKAEEAYLIHPKGEYGNAVSEGFRQEFERLGGRIAWNQSWPEGRTDFRSQLESMRKTAVEVARLRGQDTTRPAAVIFAPCENSTEAASLGGQAQALSFAPVWIGASGWHSRQFLAEAVGRLDGARLVTDRIPDERRAEWKRLVSGWKSKDPVDPLAALGYDAGLVILLGHLPIAPEVLVGASGDISLDAAGRYNILAPSLKVQKGSFVESGCQAK